ncbi:hypothetical protein AAGT95_14180 [Salinicola lusitanus]|uniref:HEPN AbiU2-like domain-containing protein n=1 Tax=Salinicola lusitanus TaxID=1949085 RepID=A0ABZ3CP89_9GAMM
MRDIEERIEQVELSMMFLATFSRSYYSFYAIWEHLDSLDKDAGYLFPFKSICNALLGDTALSWCKVFGSNAEGTHWKSAAMVQDDFRKQLFQELRVTDVEFTAYWKEMKHFRDEVIAHFNVNSFGCNYVPSFDLAMNSAAVAHKLLRVQFPKNVNYTGPLCLHDYGKQVANKIIERLLL